MELKNEEGLTEKEFLAKYRPGDYERPSVTVDTLIFAVDTEMEDEEPELLLIRRRNHPCIRQHGRIPGGGSCQGTGGGDRIKRNLPGAAVYVGRREERSAYENHFGFFYGGGAKE